MLYLHEIVYFIKNNKRNTRPLIHLNKISLDNRYENIIEDIQNKTIKKNLNKDFNWNIVVIRFDISLRKAKIRNIFRYLKTGKYIPNEVMNNMYKNYNKLWKK